MRSIYSRKTAHTGKNNRFYCIITLCLPIPSSIEPLKTKSLATIAAVKTRSYANIAKGRPSFQIGSSVEYCHHLTCLTSSWKSPIHIVLSLVYLVGSFLCRKRPIPWEFLENILQLFTWQLPRLLLISKLTKMLQ